MSKTNNAANALLKYESGQQFVPAQAMTDSGDHTTYSIAAKPWSGVAGREPVIRPDGLITGGAITPSAGNNSVTVAALTAYQAGQQIAVASGTVAVTRAADTNTHKITSITIDDTGALAAVAGTDGTAFTETRDVAGGPPLIPVGSIELGQVRLSSATAAAVTAAEIYSVPGTHTELYDFPVWDENSTHGKITFATALPAIHTGNTTRRIFAEVYTPIFAPLEPTSDFVPPETTHSQSSTQVYGGSVGSSSESLGQGSFKTYLKDGVTDVAVGLKNQTLWWQFFPHRLRAPHLLVQAKLGIARMFPAGDSISASCTLSASSAAEEIKS
ncbi:hypothetical protein [Desulfobotulus sp.]|uniref:hypothetical protein n=1 Tax=Desulfobotulus sp. TaxID=1940337 RepID=UPI002A35DE17|nr:hypothetical protein [Desulfobotulus sp.]MDY0164508.1 hypothetical protein [Desulfobotulus sp.]